jgi:hypothetical protein
MNDRLRLVLAIGLFTLLMTACSQQGKDEQPSTVQETSSVTVQTPAPTAPEAIAEPATAAEEGFVLPQEGIRPVAVMIDNEGTRVLPQGGLDKAQIIYEVIVEGGESRYMPVFWGTNPEMIGPVRSSRDYFLDYSMEHDAIYTHFGWSPKAKADISALKINNINGLYVGTDVIWDLTKDKGNWQDSYTSMEKLQKYIAKLKYRTTTETKLLFHYNQTDVVPADGQSANKIVLKYSASNFSSYEYDSSSGVYKRFRKGKPQMERVSGKQLTTKNIIVQFTRNSDIKGDTKGRQEMDTTGSGKGYFITDGKAIEIKWSKESRKAQTVYTDKNGSRIALNRGQTWIQVMPVNAKVTME